ncbi:MAG: HypC/HybG/HupF family hydrogenase formation chaperone [Pseudomonadota bacterium]
MCLGIPGKIVAIEDEARHLATVDVSGVRRAVNVLPVEGNGPLEDLIGRYVLVHVGFAMSLIDEAEAKRTLEALNELGEAQEEIAAMRASQDALGTQP